MEKTEALQTKMNELSELMTRGPGKTKLRTYQRVFATSTRPEHATLLCFCLKHQGTQSRDRKVFISRGLRGRELSEPHAEFVPFTTSSLPGLGSHRRTHEEESDHLMPL